MEVIAGFYSETLASDAAHGRALPEKIALAFIDCDLYTSTRDVLAFLSPRLKHGMILAFDDYFTYSESAISGERLALLELEQPRRDLAFIPYVQFGWHGQSFIVERRDLAALSHPAEADSSQLHPTPLLQSAE
jgi:hypothetical protein